MLHHLQLLHDVRPGDPAGVLGNVPPAHSGRDAQALFTLGGDERPILFRARHAHHRLHHLPDLHIRAKWAESEQHGDYHPLRDPPHRGGVHCGCLDALVLVVESPHGHHRLLQHQVGDQLHQVHPSARVQLSSEVNIS